MEEAAQIYKFWLEAGALVTFFIIVMAGVVFFSRWLYSTAKEWVPKLFISHINMMSDVSKAAQESTTAIKKLVDTDTLMSSMIAEGNKDNKLGFHKISDAAKPFGAILVVLAPESHKREVQVLVDQIQDILSKDD